MKSIENLLFYVLISFFLLGGHDLYGQTGAASKSQFFDAKYAIIKKSVVLNDTATFKTLNNLPIRIINMNADAIFVELKQFGEVDIPDNDLL